jgi:hypothetical protein
VSRSDDEVNDCTSSGSDMRPYREMSGSKMIGAKVIKRH